MTRALYPMIAILCGAAWLIAAACDDGTGDGGGDADSDTDVDSDTDSDTDSDGDIDCDDDMTITDEAGLAAIVACTELGGWVTITDSALTSISLPNLVSAYWLEIESNDSLTSIDLPALEEMGLHLTIQLNEELASIDLDALAHVGGTLILSNSALESISLPALTEVAGNVSLGRNEVATAIAADSLTHTGYDVGLSGNTSLTSVSFTNLETIGGYLDVFDNDSLTSLEGFSSVTAIGGENDSWAGGLSISTNSGLTSLGLDGLTDLQGELRFEENTSLPTCLATGLRDDLAFSGLVCIWGNAPDSCEDDTVPDCWEGDG